MLKGIATLMIAAAAMTTSKFSMREVGAEIYSLQSRLFELGYFDKKLTGMYGTLTEAAYKKFQQVNGFTENGIITDEELAYLYSLRVKPKIDSRRNIQKVDYLSDETFEQIDAKVTQTFNIRFTTLNKTATFKVKNSQGFLIGELQNIDSGNLTQHLRYPVVATIQNVNYPASLDISGTTVNLHFKDSKSYLGLPDSEHQSNISRLLGF